MNSKPTTASAAPSKTYNLSRTGLAAAMHNHDKAGTYDLASLFKTGELDIDLLERAQLYVSDALKRTPVVSVQAASFTKNVFTGRMETVFGVHAEGVFQGHYFSSAFRSLSV